jgi:YfiH family protein
MTTAGAKQVWTKAPIEGVIFYQSILLNSFAEVVHGFTTRNGGCSHIPFSSLNLGTHVGDDPASVEENRRRVAAAMGYQVSEIITANQVHGSHVCLVDSPPQSPQAADALITNKTNVLLMLMYADCVPIFVFDRNKRAVGLIHSGWKGTEANIVKRTVDSMAESFGTSPQDLIAVIGPCICVDHYEVSRDVAEKFVNFPETQMHGTAEPVIPYNKDKDTYLLDLRQIVLQQLRASGIDRDAVVISDQCTFANEKDFYSHRRDGGEGTQTGRMAALIGLK